MQVFLSPLAASKLEALFNWIEINWGSSAKTKFQAKLQSAVGKIALYPRSCIEVEGFKGVRRCVVSKQTSFFYRIQNNEIEIITLLDNRQNPKSLKEEIS